MTPLAYRVLKDLATPVKQRWLNDQADLLSRLSDVHCFDVSAVGEMIDEIRQIATRADDHHTVFDRTSFLPAPRTWIEGNVDGFNRVGIHLEEAISDGEKWARATMVYSTVDPASGHQPSPLSVPLGGLRLGQFGLGLEPTDFLVSTGFFESAPRHGMTAGEINEGWRHITHFMLTWATLCLAIINTPKIIGRAHHSPHRGLQRRLATQFRGQGGFSLRDWTEIKLEITPTVDASGEDPEESHLTGQRALHFCRSHLRLRLGRLEIVRSHWRGDASLGIRQSRYKLKMPAVDRTKIAIYNR
jgi:hypothetical protein